MSEQERYNEKSSFHREGGAFVFDAPPNPKETAKQAREDEAHEFQRDIVATNSKIAWFNGMLVFATFCTIGVGIWQGFISQKAANAARDAVVVARDTLTYTQSVNAQQRQDNQAASQEAKTVADRNFVQNSKTLQATIDDFKTDQRAWIGVSISGDAMTVGKGFSTSLVANNTGRTPALNSVIYLSTVPVVNGQKADFSKLVPVDAPGTIFPNGIMTASTQPSAQRVISPQTLELYQGGSFRLHAIGKITYDDVFGKHHWVTFCYELDPANLRAYNLCFYGNDVDH